jgi:hypothetical protein
MAKLSLWLVSMDPGRPFTFLDDKLAVGDSLLGITSIEQLEWMHLNPAEGRKLHEGVVLLDFMSGVRRVLADVSEQRRLLIDIPDDIDGIAKKREILTEVRARTKDLSLYADLLAGAALVTRRWLGAAKLAHDAAVDGAVAEAEHKAKQWLATDQPDGAFDRHPLHWPLVFPEVFDPARPGFDAIIGNPPFLGGKKISGPLGSAYREYLVSSIANGRKGNADLIAYFVLRVHILLNSVGQTGLIATNTLAQGDTREVGLDQVLADGVEIRQAIKSKPWPSRNTILEFAAVWTSCRPIAAAAQRIADGVVVAGIGPSLDPASRIAGKAERLASNSAIAFQGSNVVGIGFAMDPRRAYELIEAEPRNAEVLFPFLNGQDLNSRPDCSASRWIINFHDWTEERARTYSACYEQVLRQVKPQRDLLPDYKRRVRDAWWKYEHPARQMYNAIRGLERAIAITIHAKTVMPVMVATGQVFSHALNVLATDDSGMLALLSSAPHYWWAIDHGSTIKGDLRYTASDVFETLPLPELTSEMREVGARLDTFRRDLMLARQAGLTATYNLVHDPKCADADIAELRAIHRAIDEVVVRAYGWTDLVNGLDHGFHDTRQGIRYTIGPVVRQEIRDRLLELNHACYAAEVKSGLHNKGRRKQVVQAFQHTGNAVLFLPIAASPRRLSSDHRNTFSNVGSPSRLRVRSWAAPQTGSSRAAILR